MVLNNFLTKPMGF